MPKIVRWRNILRNSLLIMLGACMGAGGSLAIYPRLHPEPPVHKWSDTTIWDPALSREQQFILKFADHMAHDAQELKEHEYHTLEPETEGPPPNRRPFTAVATSPTPSPSGISPSP